MFTSARIKLTIWYVLAIMLISVLFSIAFYSAATREFRRFAGVRQLREENLQIEPFIPPALPANMIRDVEETEARLKIILILLNGGIFIFAVGSGYFLSGRTLKPIKEMVDEQNRFITDASHELRTPLTAIRSETEVGLRDKNLNLKEAKSLLESNLEEVISLQALSDNLLELTQSEFEASPFSNLNIAGVLNNAVKKVSPIAKNKKISIKNSSNKFIVFGDDVKLTQLFIILLDNATKYSKEGSKVTISTKKTDHTIVVEIADEGVGIARADLPYIFDRFYRSDKSRSKLVNGYGLGLSIAKKIVIEHNGNISVKSEIDRGTKFYVSLPIKNVA